MRSPFSNGIEINENIGSTTSWGELARGRDCANITAFIRRGPCYQGDPE